MQQASLHEEAREWPAAEKAYRALLEKDPSDGHTWYRLGHVLHSAGQLDGAIEANQRAAEFADVRKNALYNLACAYARKGRTDDAMKQLALSVEAGFKDKRHIESDPDLDSLRSDARYNKLVETL